MQSSNPSGLQLPFIGSALSPLHAVRSTRKQAARTAGRYTQSGARHGEPRYIQRGASHLTPDPARVRRAPACGSSSPARSDAASDRRGAPGSGHLAPSAPPAAATRRHRRPHAELRFHAGAGAYFTCFAGGAGACFHFGAPCTPADAACTTGGAGRTSPARAGRGHVPQWGAACAPASGCMFDPPTACTITATGRPAAGASLRRAVRSLMDWQIGLDVHLRRGAGGRRHL